MATQYALDRLYKHIIFIGIDLKEPFEYSREAGYINTLQQHQLIPQIFRVSNHSHAAQDVIHEHFKEFKKDTCFVCAVIELQWVLYGNCKMKALEFRKTLELLVLMVSF